MFTPFLDPLFPPQPDAQSSHPPTPTLPGLQDPPHSNPSRYHRKQLSVITKLPSPVQSPVTKTSRNRKSINTDVPVRRNLFGEFSIPEDSKQPIIEIPSPTKRSLRSLSTSSNDKGKYYLHEINTLNTKIRNLIKEQESLREKLFVQENIVQGLQRPGGNQVYYEIQSATIPDNQSFDDCFFNATFRPQEKWMPKSRKFPRDVFSRPIKNK